MALAARAGIPLDVMYDVVTNAAGNSWMFENRMRHVVDGDYTPHSAVDIFVKDLGLVADTAKALHFPLPLALSQRYRHETQIPFSSALLVNLSDILFDIVNISAGR